MSSLERREYTLEELIPFGGGRATQEANRAELARLRAVEAAAREVVAVQSGQDGQIGVEYLDSYRGFICPGCAPFYEQGKARHEDGCPFKRLVEALEIIA